MTEPLPEPTPAALAPLEVLRGALLDIQVGNLVYLEAIRPTLTAAGIGGNSIGALLARAVRNGWLEVVRSEVSTQRSRKGGRSLVYRRRPIGTQGRGLHRDRQQPPLPLEGLDRT